MGDEQAAIRNLYVANVAALNAGDLVALEALYTEDAIQLPPDRPPLTGREAIRSSLEKELSGIKIHAVVEVREAVVSTGWAYARGHYQTTIKSQDVGPMTVTTGSWLDILKRGADGSWRIARSVWSKHGAEVEDG